MAVTRRQLQDLGLEWPLSEPSDVDEPIDLDRVGWGLYWEISDNRTDQTENQARLDALNALIERLDRLGVAWK